MNWEHLSIYGVQLILTCLWPVILCFCLFKKVKDDMDDSSDWFIKDFIIRHLLHWSFISLSICSILICTGLIVGKSMALDFIETKGYRIVIEEENWLRKQYVVVDSEEYRDFVNITSLFDHEHKLVFARILDYRYDGDSPPESMTEIKFTFDK